MRRALALAAVVLGAMTPACATASRRSSEPKLPGAPTTAARSAAIADPLGPRHEASNVLIASGRA